MSFHVHSTSPYFAHIGAPLQKYEKALVESDMLKLKKVTIVFRTRKYSVYDLQTLYLGSINAISKI